MKIYSNIYEIYFINKTLVYLLEQWYLLNLSKFMTHIFIIIKQYLFCTIYPKQIHNAHKKSFFIQINEKIVEQQHLM